MVHGPTEISKTTILQSIINHQPIKLGPNSSNLFSVHHAHREINQYSISPGPVNEQSFQLDRRRLHQQQEDYSHKSPLGLLRVRRVVH